MCAQYINLLLLTYCYSAELNKFLFLLLESENTYVNGEIVGEIKRFRYTVLSGAQV